MNILYHEKHPGVNPKQQKSQERKNAYIVFELTKEPHLS